MAAHPVSMAIIGCGYITQAEHVPALLTVLPDVRVSATVDPHSERAAAVAQPFGAPHFTSLDAAMRDASFEAVLIATPGPTHPALVEQAARAGKHILLEKPLAYDRAAARAAIEAVEAAGVRCMVAYHRRFDDDCREALRLLQGGAIGTPRAAVSQCRLALPSIYRSYAPSPKAPPAADAPAHELAFDWLTENTIHHLNLLRFWLGDVTRLHSAVYRGRDHNLGAITFSCGEVLVTHHQLRGMECGETISVYGDAGALHLDLWYPHRPYAFPRITLFDRAAQTRQDIIRPRASPYTNELMAFLRHLREDGENVSTLADALRDLELLVAIREAAIYLEG